MLNIKINGNLENWFVMSSANVGHLNWNPLIYNFVCTQIITTDANEKLSK